MQPRTAMALLSRPLPRRLLCHLPAADCFRRTRPEQKLGESSSLHVLHIVHVMQGWSSWIGCC